MSDVDEVKRRTDIVEVVGKTVQLRKAGRNLSGLCPFHHEKTPSFIVNPDRQTWHCFGACSTGGDVITFIERAEGLDFRQALESLARQAGVELRDRPKERSKAEGSRRLQTLLASAAAFYHRALLAAPEAEEARAYAGRRGLTGETLETFEIGYAAAEWAPLRDDLLRLGFREAELVQSGLAIDGQSGPYPRFRDRLLFPLRDETGACVGFGGRSLDDSQPKYLNTPQSEVFDKGGMLYGLHLAKPAIREADRAVIVEGYMDVIATHQADFQNVVASMGTALTERQVALLKRYTRKLVVAMDADEAGLEAAQRSPHVVMGGDLKQPTLEGMSRLGTMLSRRFEIDLRIAPLPDALDPDDLVRSDPERWRTLIESAQPWSEFLIDRALARAGDGARDLAVLVREVAPIIAAAGDGVEQAVYIQRLATRVGVGEEVLTKAFARRPSAQQRRRPAQPASPPAPSRPPRTDPGDGAEQFLVALLLRYPEVDRQTKLDESAISDAQLRRILDEYRRDYDLDRLQEEDDLKAGVQQLLEIRVPPLAVESAAAAVQDAMRRLERRRLREMKSLETVQIAHLEEQVGARRVVEALLSEDAGASERLDDQEEELERLRGTLMTSRALHLQETNPLP
jgi:DNA primase